MNAKDFGILKAKRRVVNEDWKTALAHNQPAIEEGQLVTFIQRYRNFYGNWIIVLTNDNRYYVSEDDFEGNFLVLDRDDSYFSIEALRTVSRKIFKDRYGKRYLLLNDNGDLQELK